MGIGLTGTSPKRALRGPSARVTLKDLSTVNVRTVMPPSTVARAAASPPHASTSPAAFPLFGDSFISLLILDRKTAPRTRRQHMYYERGAVHLKPVGQPGLPKSTTVYLA